MALVLDLSAAGRCYHDHIDTHGRGPASWEAFQQFAAQGGLESGVLDRLQAAGYQFVWNVDLSSGISMVQTVLAQSPSRSPQLMLDGSLAGVTPEVVERARQARQTRTGSGSPLAAAAAAPSPPAPALLPPSTPMEQAVYNYLVLCDEWFAALAQIRDLSSAETAKRTIRALDARFDQAGEELGRQGMQIDFLATPPKYQSVVARLSHRQAREDNRLRALPDAARINQLFVAEENTLGPVGPRRTMAKIVEAFERRSMPAPDAVAAANGGANPPDVGHLLPTPPEDAVFGIPPVTMAPQTTATPPVEEQVESAEMRTWSDSTGRFETRAALVSHDSREVRLRREDGEEVSIPLARLSKADRDYLTRLAREERGGSYRKGDVVEVLWGSSWYAATVLEAESQRFFIRYDGWSDQWNEWVGPERIRKPGGK